MPISDKRKRKIKILSKVIYNNFQKVHQEVAAKIAHSTETTNIDELQFLRYLLKYVPGDKKLLCLSDICRRNL